MTDASLDDTEAMIRQTENAFAQQQADAQRFTEAMRQLTVKASNKNQSVKVKVDANGCLADLRLDPAAMKLTPEKLRDEIMRGIRHAQHKLAEQVDELATQVWGPDTKLAAHMYQQYVAAFGVDDPEKQV